MYLRQILERVGELPIRFFGVVALDGSLVVVEVPREHHDGPQGAEKGVEQEQHHRQGYEPVVEEEAQDAIGEKEQEGEGEDDDPDGYLVLCCLGSFELREHM